MVTSSVIRAMPQGENERKSEQYREEMEADLERRGIPHVDVAGNQHCHPLQFSVFI